MAFETPSDQEFVEFIVKSIVDNPEKVEASRSVDEMGVLIQLSVDPADMGKIIGKSGQNAQALRTLLRVLGAKNNARVNLKILEPEGGNRERNERPSKEEKKEEKNAADDVPTDVLV